jgi:TRAP-type mannitol/chloroaromatic compound transport system substrate-binding protein
MTERGVNPDRRRLLGIGLAATGLAMPAIARAEEPIVWKMATAWPKDTPGLSSSARRIADSIATMSGGRLSIKVLAAGELVPADQVFDAVSSGKADAGHSASYYWQAKDRAFHFFTGVPFGLTGTEHAAWLYFGGGQSLWERAYQPFGVVPFFAGTPGPQAAGWFMKEVRTLDDLKGVKMRIAGLGAEIFRRLGVEVVPMPVPKIVDALKNGDLTAAEWVGPWNDRTLGLNQAAKFYYMPGFNEIGSAVELIVNQAAWSALPLDLREIVRRAAMAAATESTADFTYHNIAALKSLTDQGVEVRSFPVAILQAAAAESAAILAELAGASPIAAEVHQSFVDYRARAAAYCRSADLAALKMREIALTG